MLRKLSELKLTQDELKEKNDYIRHRFIEVMVIIKNYIEKNNTSFIKDWGGHGQKDAKFFFLDNDEKMVGFFKYFLDDYVSKYYKIDNTDLISIVEKNDVNYTLRLITDFIIHYNDVINDSSDNIENLDNSQIEIFNDKDSKKVEINIIDELSRIDYTFFSSFTRYFVIKRDENRGSIFDLEKKIRDKKVEIEKDFLENGVFEGDRLPNGKFYIKYRNGDKEKIDNHTEILRLRAELNKLYGDSLNKIFWFDTYSIEGFYKNFEEDFHKEIYKRRMSDITSLLIKPLDYIKSRKEYEGFLESLKEVKLNKKYSEILKNDGIEFLFSLLLDPTQSLWKNISEEISLSDEEKEFIKEYERVKMDIETRNPSARDWQIKRKFLEQPALKSMYQKMERLHRKISTVNDIRFDIGRLFSKYEEYKENFIKYKHIKHNVYGDYNSITLYNNHVDKLPVNRFYSFQYRLYTNSGGDGWGGEEYTSGMIIASDENELVYKVSKLHNVKCFTGKWLKKYIDEGYFKLWTGEKIVIEGTDLNGLKLHICKNCNNVSRSVFGKEDDKKDVCSYGCYQSLQESNKIEDKQNKRNIGEDVINNSSFLDELDDVVSINKDIEKDSIDFSIKNEAVIYRILNKITGLSYVGKTNQGFATRWAQHFSSDNSVFIEDIKKHGIIAFSFEILEDIKLSDLKGMNSEEFHRYVLIREQFYIDKLDTYNNGYNRRNNFQKEKIEVRTKASDNNLSLSIGVTGVK